MLYLSLLDRVVLYIMEDGNYYNLFLSSKGRWDRFAELNLYPNTKTTTKPLELHGFWFRSIQLVITKGYEVRATTIEGQNAFAPTLYFAQVEHDRWSKHARTDYE